MDLQHCHANLSGEYLLWCQLERVGSCCCSGSVHHRLCKLMCDCAQTGHLYELGTTEPKFGCVPPAMPTRLVLQVVCLLVALTDGISFEIVTLVRG